MYWIKRLSLGLVLLLCVSMLTFGAMNMLGDPLFNLVGLEAVRYDELAQASIDGTITGSDQEILDKMELARSQYNLDKPLPQRYAIWLGDFITGEFGVQFSDQTPVSDVIKERAPRTIALLTLAQLLAAMISIPWAVFASSRPNGVFDRSSAVTSFAFVAMPAFVLGVVLRFLFSIKIGLFPLTYETDVGILKGIHQLILPALTIALPAAAVYQRLLRTDLITTLQEDFILMARSKGVSKRKVLFGHALRPSMFSFITVFAINTGTLIGGTLVVERIFRIPGLGSTIAEAVFREDFPPVLAIVMLVAAAFVVLNLLVDVLYSILDPRVRS